MAGNNFHSRKVILVIEDEPLVRELVVDFLMNHQVFGVGNGDEAIAWFKKHPNIKVDLVISDYSMPGKDGIETVKEIRSIVPHVKSILMSATVLLELRQLAPENGFDGWLTKPFSVESLKSTVERVLSLPDPSGANTAVAGRRR